MSILITGASGFLGAYIVKSLKSQGQDVIAMSREDCDLSSAEQTHIYLSTVKVSMVVHCAAFVPSTLNEYEDKELSRNNGLLLQNLLNSTSCPIIYISSMTVYGASKNKIRSEAECPNPQSEYGMSKYLGEQYLRESNRKSLVIRIPGLFGHKRDNGLIYNCIGDLLNSCSPTLPESSILWAAMDVEDAALSIVKLITSYSFDAFDIINIGYDETYSISKLVKIYEELFDIKLDYKVEQPDFIFDLKKLKQASALPNESLKTAIEKLKVKYVRT